MTVGCLILSEIDNKQKCRIYKDNKVKQTELLKKQNDNKSDRLNEHCSKQQRNLVTNQEVNSKKNNYTKKHYKNMLN